MHQLTLVEKDGNLHNLASAGVRRRREIPLTRSGLNLSDHGSLATSIAAFLSHDIRHHLSVVYCNAEFLGQPATLETGRMQLLEEVRLAIHNVTQMLIFRDENSGRHSGKKRRPCGNHPDHCGSSSQSGSIPKRSAILTSPARESASIFRMI
jgi:hypothetical protein